MTVLLQQGGQLRDMFGQNEDRRWKIWRML